MKKPVLAFLLFAALTPFSRAQSTLPTLVQRAVDALNARKPDAFAALAALGVDTTWVKNVTASPDPASRKWTGGVISVGGDKWAVFSLDKMVEMDHDHIYRVAKRNGAWILVAGVEEAEPGRHWRITAHNLMATLMPARRSAVFGDVVTVKPIGTGQWPLIFDVGLGYKIDAMRWTDTNRPVSYTRAGNLIRVNEPAKAGARISISYDRTFTASPGFLSNMSDTDALFYADWLPVISYQPAPSRITMETPKGWDSIAQGDLVSTKPGAAGSTRRTFLNKAPVSFIMAAAGKYHETTHVANGVPLSTYMLNYDREKSERGLKTLAFAYPFYTKLFGPMPWKHYTLVEVRALLGLAQEGYSFSVYSSSYFPGASAHELGHSWWGGHVNNTYFGSYWNESLTSYSTDMVAEARHGALSAHSNRLSEIRHYSTGVEGRGDIALMAASNSPWGPVTMATTYNKGAVVCHMLRRELGDAVFFRTLRHFANAYAGKAADWGDLARIATAEAKRPMWWFFEQWTRRPGGLRLRWEDIVTVYKNGNADVTATLVQDGTPYKAHVLAALDGVGGRVAKTVWVTGARTKVHLVSKGTPSRLVADPNDDLLRRLAPEEVPIDTDTAYFGHHPLVIIYGTHGDAAYAAATKKQAESEAIHWKELNDGVFADLSDIKVMPDTDLEKTDVSRSNIIVIGKPGVNSFFERYNFSQPVSLTPGDSVTIEGKTLRGPDYVTIINLPHPSTDGLLLTIWSGTSAKAMALPRELTSGDVYGGFSGVTHAAYVARNGSIVAWSDRGAVDHRTYIFK